MSDILELIKFELLRENPLSDLDDLPVGTVEVLKACRDEIQQLRDALANIKHCSGIASTAYQIASKALQEQDNG